MEDWMKMVNKAFEAQLTSPEYPVQKDEGKMEEFYIEEQIKEAFQRALEEKAAEEAKKMAEEPDQENEGLRVAYLELGEELAQANIKIDELEEINEGLRLENEVWQRVARQKQEEIIFRKRISEGKRNDG